MQSIFISVYLSQTDDTMESKLSDVQENDSFAVPLIYLGFGRELKEDYVKEGESEEERPMIGLQES